MKLQFKSTFKFVRNYVKRNNKKGYGKRKCTNMFFSYLFYKTEERTENLSEPNT